MFFQIPPPALSAAVVAPPEVRPSSAPAAPNDLFEPVNRANYRINTVLERAVVRPVISTYEAVVPRPVRNSVHNFIDNWNEPVVCLNDGLQLNARNAGSAAVRFSINTTVGVLGLFDVASRMGVDKHDNAFALTLGRYGVASGPYLYLPLVGPSSVRDATGAVVDFLTNPITQVRRIKSESVEVAQEIAVTVDSPVESVIAAVDVRSTNDPALRDIEATATDPYATLRAAYLQRMEAQIAGDRITLDQSPDIPETSAPVAPAVTPAAAPAPATRDGRDAVPAPAPAGPRADRPFTPDVR